MGFKTDGCGKRLWNWLQDNNFRCHNSGQVTFLRGISSSTLDLTFSCGQFIISSWETFDNGTSSDHVPITYEIMLPHLTSGIRQQRFINYKIYKTVLNSALSSLGGRVGQQRAASVVASLSDSVQPAEFSVKYGSTPSSSAWWNEDCTLAYRRRKAAWKRLRHNHTPKNWVDYKFHAALFKRTVATAKDKHKSDLHSHLSKPDKRSALYRFLRNKNLHRYQRIRIQ